MCQRSFEHDGHDATAVHAVAVRSAVVIATGRLVAESATTGRIGRMAVASHLRRRNLGSLVLHLLEQQAKLQGRLLILLHAQTPVRAFYAHHGCTAQGEEFMEAGIHHIAMVKHL